MKRLIAVALVISLGFCAICWSVLNEMGERDRELARVNAANLVASVGAEISRNIEMFDLSLQAAADGIKLPNIFLVPPEMRQMILFDRAATAKGLGTIIVLDRNGDVVAESRSAATRRENYGDRDYFQVHKFNPASGRYITSPWLTRRGDWVIGITRRLTDEKGEFAGVVLGTMTIDYLREVFERIKRKPGDVVSLVRDNGNLIMRVPFDVRLVGQNVAGTRIFQTFSGRESGHIEAVAGIDGVRRLYSYEHIKDLPFVLSYGSSTQALYFDWWQRAWRIGAMVLALCFTNLALVIFLARSLRRSDIAEKSLEKIAVTDALTGLANRRRFDQVMEVEWNRMRRDERPMSLLMIDADHFKDFNDTHGHQAGDTALAAIADCIAHATRRSSECSARYGGEEFAVVLPDETVEGAQQIAQKIISHLEELRARQQGRDDCTPTVSIGIATLVPQAGLGTHDLVKAADAALYQAKQAGRARCVASPSQLSILAKKMAA